ncbi:MAG TPA: EamA family transporter [Rhodocyclaceae bacterium]|nr:EamA family transporter [Rhodocyclaceae bacterium]
MNNNILLILLSSVLTAIGQVAFKFGMRSFAEVEYSRETLALQLWQIFTSPSIILGFAAFGLGAVLWLFALARAELSYAVPLASLTYVLVLAAGVVLFREPLTAAKIVGTALVAAGVVCVSLK